MNKKELNYIKENYFQEDVDLNLLFEMIDQVKESPRDPLLQEQEGGRFSFAIDLPSLTPSEAWGDPDSQDRDQILKIFSVVRGGKDMRAKMGAGGRKLIESKYCTNVTAGKITQLLTGLTKD